jgi:hypothetical protein
MRNILRVCSALVLVLVSAPCGARITLPPTSTLSSYADPRNYGTPGQVVCGGNFTNDATNDDAPAVQRALNAYPVVLLPSGCKFVTQVQFTAPGQRLGSWGSGSNYSAPVAIQPYEIYIPDAAASNATSNCIIDTKGFDGVMIDHLGFFGHSPANGTVAVCNSVGIAGGAAQAFLTLDSVDFIQMGNGIGTAMSTGNGPPTYSGCDPTGSLGNPVFQFRAHHLTFEYGCSGISANYSDVHAEDIFCGNIQGPCIASPHPGNGIGSTFINGRCEYNFDNYGSKYDGACIYVDGGFNTFQDWIFDHPFGQCMSLGVGDTGNNASYTTLINVSCNSANQGAQYSAITNVCNFVVQAVANLQAYGVDMVSDPASLYGLCFVGAPSAFIKWDQPSYNVGAGWTNTFLHGTTPNGPFDFQVAGAYRATSDIIASTTLGQATPTTLNSSGVPLQSSYPTSGGAVTCNSGTQGYEFTVTNASSPTIGSPVAYAATGGVWAKIDCNGSVWNVSAK